MARLLRRLAPSVLLIALGSAATVAVFAWEPWGSSGEADAPVVSTSATPQPTRDQPTLTNEEVIGLVVAECGNAPLIARDATASYEGVGKWTVEVNQYRWRVFEATRTVISLGTPFPCPAR